MTELVGWRKALDSVLRAVVPIVLALVVAGLILLAMGVDPLALYGNILSYGLNGKGWENCLVLMAPLLIMGLGLIVVFRGGLWNLGYDGQFLLGATFTAGFAPWLLDVLPAWLVWIITMVGSMVVGAIFSIIPAFLRAKYGTNEIITSLVMSTIGVSISTLLVKGPFRLPNQSQQKTTVIDRVDRLPDIPGTTIHIGIFIALILMVAAWYVIRRTSWGLRLDIFGASPKSAAHIGINSMWMIMLLFMLSGALIGLAGSIDILGDVGYMRTSWNPGYGEAVMPFILLAKLNPLSSILLIAFYSILSVGGTLAATKVGLSVDFLMVIVALILVFMTVTDYVANRRANGQSYLPEGLRYTFRQLTQGRATVSAEKKGA